jgi:hypothetical protein
VALGKKVGVVSMLVVKHIEIGELLVWLKHNSQREARPRGGSSQVVEEAVAIV